MKKERENSKLCYINGVDIIEYVSNKIDDIVVELQKVRLQKGISLYKLAQMTGLAHTTIMRIENLSTQPSLEALMRMALALEVDINIFDQSNSELVEQETQCQLSNCEKENSEIQLCTSFAHTYYGDSIGKAMTISRENLITPSKLVFSEFVREIYSYTIFQIDASKYIDEIDTFLHRYICSINRYNLEQKIANRISEFSNNLLLVLREYYIGQHTSAYELFSEAMNKIDVTPLICLLQEQKLYRARERKTDAPLRNEAFFHIPFEKRTKVSSQRYSFPGLPCLYMGTSVDVCLRELGHRKNPIDVAELQVIPNKAYCILDLTSIFSKSAELMDMADQRVFMELFPLVFLCSTRINEDYREAIVLETSLHRNSDVNGNEIYFRPDYIIPQLLLEYILDKTVWRENPIIGIQYYSVQEDFYSKWLGGNIQKLSTMKNVAIPVRTSANTGHCKELSTLFRVNQIL